MLKIQKDTNFVDVDCDEFDLNSFLEKLNTFEHIDELLKDLNKIKYQTTKEMIDKISKIKIPNIIEKDKISLLGLYYYFHATFSSKDLEIAFDIFEQIKHKIPYKQILISSKLNNFPHIIGVRPKRDENGEITSKTIPKLFLDGVLFQWITLNSPNEMQPDFEKVEVISWIKNTIKNPTYIVDSSAINVENTKINADFVLVKNILGSSKYIFHLVFLKHIGNDHFAIMSQFPIIRERYNRINKMFNLDKAIYNYYEATR